MNHQALPFKFKQIILLLTLISFCTLNLNAQPNRFSNPTEKIRSLINIHLNPTSPINLHNEVLRITIIPSGSIPESVLSLQKSRKQMILNLVSFRASISDQVMAQFITNKDTAFTTDTAFYSTTISEELSNSLQQLFSSAGTNNDNRATDNGLALDGTLYLFQLHNSKQKFEFQTSTATAQQMKVSEFLSWLTSSIKKAEINEEELKTRISAVLSH